jgi:hypothetical protein
MLAGSVEIYGSIACLCETAVDVSQMCFAQAVTVA